MSPCSFSDLPERARLEREKNWFLQNYHGIEWFDGEANLKYFTLQRYTKLHGKHAINIPEGKKKLVISPEMFIIWKEFPCHLKNCLMAKRADNVVLITDFKLKISLRVTQRLQIETLIIQNSSNSSYNSSVLNENWDVKSSGVSKAGSDNGIFAITNQNFDVIRNIEAWRNNVIKEEEKN